MPDDEPATWAVAVMELGALVCTANTPRATPARCRTGAPGCAPADRRTTDRRGAAQAWAGTDRMVRGRLMAVLRDTEGSVAAAAPRRRPGPTPVQRERALASLLADGLVVEVDGRYALPG